MRPNTWLFAGLLALLAGLVGAPRIASAGEHGDSVSGAKKHHGKDKTCHKTDDGDGHHDCDKDDALPPAPPPPPPTNGGAPPPAPPPPPPPPPPFTQPPV